MSSPLKHCLHSRIPNTAFDMSQNNDVLQTHDGWRNSHPWSISPHLHLIQAHRRDSGQIISPYIYGKSSKMMHTHTHRWFHLMCVAGRDSNCLERKSSRCLSWCFCFSGRSIISEFSISSSSSPVVQKSKYIFIQPPADVH